MVFHLLTAVLVVLKVLELISVSWWVVLAPSIVIVVIGSAIAIFALVMAAQLK